MVPGVFWGLLRKPDGMPCLFGSRQDAEDNRDYDEYLVEVRVHPASAIALLRGRQELLRRQKKAKAKSRPRLPVAQKRRRGSAVVRLKGGGMVHRALKEMAPAMRRKLAQAMNDAVFVGGMDLAKGRDHSAEIKVTKGNVVSHRFIKRAIKKGAKRAAAPRVRR